MLFWSLPAAALCVWSEAKWDDAREKGVRSTLCTAAPTARTRAATVLNGQRHADSMKSQVQMFVREFWPGHWWIRRVRR